MQMKVFAQDRNVAPVLREWVERRLSFALGRFAARIEEITVRFRDINGPRGGVDQQCRIEVSTVRLGKLTAQAIGHDAEAAVSLAADRIARRLKDVIDRKRTIRLHAGANLRSVAQNVH
jgi:putative sigma-54 modulation protein